MSRAGGLYVNLLSHSPVNTPCPDYRIADYDFIDDTTVPIDSGNNNNNNVSAVGNLSCEVEIHHDHTESSRANHEIRNLLDFDTDDENILSSLNVLMSDCSSLDLTPRKFAYPDANSHSNYNLLNDDTPSSEISRSRNLDVPFINNNNNNNRNHRMMNIDKQRSEIGNLGQTGEIFISDNSDINGMESYEACSSYSVANSHGVYGLLSEDSEKSGEIWSRERLISIDRSDNYEIANSHSNYQIFYNRSDFTDWETSDEHTTNNGEDTKKCLSIDGTSCGKFQDFARSRMKLLDDLTNRPPNGSESRSDSSKSTEETSTSCDIEDCLIQIEESLMNIEQNLLHVQELDIPELKNVLYESPNVERKIHQDFEDILSKNNISLMKKSTWMVKQNDLIGTCVTDRSEGTFGDRFPDNLFTDRVVTDEIIEEKSLNRDTENDENVLQFTDEFSMSENLEYSTSLPSSTRESIVYPNADKNVNFIPNSLGKIPARSRLADTKENIPGEKSHSTKNPRRRSLDESIIDLINYNLNNFTNDKKIGKDRPKCQSRTNSLDENSIHRCFDNYENVNKASLENLHAELQTNYLGACGKARSENEIGNLCSGCPIVREKKLSNSDVKKYREARIAQVEAKAEEFRRMIENIVTKPRLADKAGFDVTKGNKTSKNLHKSSPKSCSVGNRINDKNNTDTFRGKGNDSPSNNKPYVYEKRKRKKLTNRTQSSENAIVPSKIISLSLSLLLAALLQAVRCLADLVEDAFRSVSFEKNGLLE